MKNIVIAPCGNKSFLFQDAWMDSEPDRNFDICLLFYHEHIDHPEKYQKVDYFFHLKDFKYKMIYDLLVNIKPEWLDEYDHFYFLDDDIEINTKDINQLFLLSKAFETKISCASLSHDSFCSWPIFRQNKNCFLRYVGQIEVMAPMFDREALKICMPTFIENRSSWGFDSVWSKLLNYTENKLIVFDSVVMKHTLPVGGGELYIKIGVNPHDEWKAINKKYGARLQNFVEYGRLENLHIQTNRNYRLVNSLKEVIVIIKRKIVDYDILSRLKNKLSRPPKESFSIKA